MIVVAVKHFDIDACICHSTREQAKLPRSRLVESLHKHIAHGDNMNASVFKGSASGFSVRKQEVCHALAIDDERPSPFYAHSATPQGIAHSGESPGLVFQCNCQILHQVCVSFSISSNCSFRSTPQRYPPNSPPSRTTR